MVAFTSNNNNNNNNNNYISDLFIYLFHDYKKIISYII